MAVSTFLEQLGYLFYITSPQKTSFETAEEVPDYIVQVVPHFALLFILEQVILLYQKKPTVRINDGIGSITQGMLQEISKIVIRGVQIVFYTYIYNNWRLVTLPWDSVWTWLICFIATDFAYYWLHRASHEINILWAAHQVHHSSEDYNLSTALRQSVFQAHSTWIFNMPMALGIPPGVFLVHNQFNLLYQFWVHTELISSLGPLEYILNTASHHRVHHGRNRYCIDKNYAGTLIIWDRLFGTFEPESEKVVYGLTHPINSFEPFYIQLCHYMHILRTFRETKGFWNKLSVIFKGPGWSPGNPWHGNIEDIPDAKYPVEKYDPYVPFWCKVYAVIHMILLLVGYVEMSERSDAFPQIVLYAGIIYEVFSMTSIGMLLEGRLYTPWLELLRCTLYFFLDYHLMPFTRLYQTSSVLSRFILIYYRTIFAASTLFWLWYCLKSTTIKLYSVSDKKLK